MSPDAQKLDADIRGCISQNDEIALDIYKNYSQANCFFECRKDTQYYKIGSFAPI